MRYATTFIILAIFTVGCSSGNEPAVAGADAVLQVASAELLERATVPEEQARAIALEASGGGAIVEAELEEEGELLIYSFEVRTAEGLMDIEVDATSGAVLEAELDEDDEDDDDDDDDEHDDDEGHE